MAAREGSVHTVELSSNEVNLAAQIIAVLCTCRDERLSQKRIAKELGVRKATIGLLLGACVKARLVRLIPRAGYTLTARGAGLARRAGLMPSGDQP